MATARSKSTPAGVLRALAEWERDVRERPADYARIDEYIRGVDGAQWSGEPYAEQYQWCGFFTGWALGLKAPIRKYHMPSVSRLMRGHRLGHWAAGTVEGLAPGNRFVAAAEAQPGDIGIFGNTEPGQHIGIILERDGDGFQTVEGNAWGTFPDGSKGEGVIRTWRPLPGYEKKARDYALLHVIRPIRADFEGA